MSGPSPVLGRLRTSTVLPRRERVVWSGTRSSRPIKRTREPTKPSVWRSPRWNSDRSVRVVSIATSEYSF
jgi:hypothetical protein